MKGQCYAPCVHVPNEIIANDDVNNNKNMCSNDDSGSGAHDENYNISDDDKVTDDADDHHACINGNDGPAVDNLHDLLPDFVIESTVELSEEDKCHRVAFYQAALSLMAKKANNKMMMMKDKYLQIKDACIQLHEGETMTHLRKSGFLQIHCWSKKYGIVVAGGNSFVLVERPGKTDNDDSGGGTVGLIPKAILHGLVGNVGHVVSAQFLENAGMTTSR